ncbi:MAG TPA: hypothetical protein VIA62_15245 [Thermoanaerobaculia bacterium]|jgi:hypothetical protein|nr:hypothetical protein [Thermoanaerobaculia bacterium]
MRFFNDALLDEMRHLVPSRQRSGFVEEAARARLEQLKQVQAAEAAAGAWSAEGREDPSREIEESRRAWEGPAAPDWSCRGLTSSSL